jgi:hypothetical protein
MATASLDLSDLLKDIPPGSWVAVSLDPDRVVASGPDAQFVFDQAKEAGEDAPLMVRVPEEPRLMFL